MKNRTGTHWIKWKICIYENLHRNSLLYMIYICTYISSFYLSVILSHVPSILLYVVLNYTVLYFTILNYTILYDTILYNTIFYYTLLNYTTLNYTILYYTILYYTEIYFYGSSGFLFYSLHIIFCISLLLPNTSI